MEVKDGGETYHCTEKSSISYQGDTCIRSTQSFKTSKKTGLTFKTSEEVSVCVIIDKELIVSLTEFFSLNNGELISYDLQRPLREIENKKSFSKEIGIALRNDQLFEKIGNLTYFRNPESKACLGFLINLVKDGALGYILMREIADNYVQKEVGGFPLTEKSLEHCLLEADGKIESAILPRDIKRIVDDKVSPVLREKTGILTNYESFFSDA